MDCRTHEKQGDKDTRVTRERMQLRGWRTCLLSMFKALSVLSFFTRAKRREGGGKGSEKGHGRERNRKGREEEKGKEDG